MERRQFVAGVGAVTTAGAGLLGSGAFSRTESERSVSVQTAADTDAYLELNVVTGSANSQNYVIPPGFDDDGHIEIFIEQSGQNGFGVNSNSFSYFDDLFKICNRGKAEANVYIDDEIAGVGDGDGEIKFYSGTASGSQGEDGIESLLGQENQEPVGIGDCLIVGLRANSRGISAIEEDELFEDYVTIVADSPDAGDEDYDG